MIPDRPYEITLDFSSNYSVTSSIEVQLTHQDYSSPELHYLDFQYSFIFMSTVIKKYKKLNMLNFKVRRINIIMVKGMRYAKYDFNLF